MNIRSKRLWCVASLGSVLLLTIIFFALHSRPKVRVEFKDGSWLELRAITYGTNHIYYKRTWHQFVQEGSFLNRPFRLTARAIGVNLRSEPTTEPFVATTYANDIFVWGEWDGAGTTGRVFRFTLVDESGKELATLKQFGSLPPRQRWGCLGRTMNGVPTGSVRLLVFDETPASLTKGKIAELPIVAAMNESLRNDDSALRAQIARVSKARSSERVEPNASPRPPRVGAWLGLGLQNADPKDYPPPVHPGVIVRQIVPRSPADLANLRLGDRVFAVDNEPITDAEHFKQLMAAKSVGQPVALKVARDYATLTVAITPRDWPQ